MSKRKTTVVPKDDNEPSTVPGYIGSSPPPVASAVPVTPAPRSPLARMAARSKPLGSASIVKDQTPIVNKNKEEEVNNDTAHQPPAEDEPSKVKKSVIKPPPRKSSPKPSIIKDSQSKTKEEPEPSLDPIALSSSTGPGRIRSLASDKTVDRQLGELGYKVEDVLLVDANGSVEARFAIVVDGVGNIVMVDLDTDGAVAVQKNCITLVETNKPSRVSHSLKLGSLKSVELLCSGVAFKSNREVCVVRSGDQAVENIFISPNALSDDIRHSQRRPDHTPSITIFNEQNLKSNPIPMPLIKMSELLGNPTQVSENIAVACRRMRTSSMARITLELERFKDSSHNLSTRSDLVQRMFLVQFDEIAKKMIELDRYRQSVMSRGSTNSNTKSKLQVIEYNMAKRQMMLKGLLEMSGTLNVLNDEITRLTVSVDDLAKHLNELYQENKVLTDHV